MEPTTDKYREGLSKNESFLIALLSRQDKAIFTANEAKAIAGEGAKKLLFNLVKKKWILPLKRGLYAVVPLDVGVKGADSFIIHNFVIAANAIEPYYIGFWSALNHYGFSDQIPSATFIATTKARKPITVLNARYIFVQLDRKKFMGITEVEIGGKKIRISDKEKTIADCLDHPEHAGGIDEVARAIFFSVDEIDFMKVREYGSKMGNLTIFKRLGYILESSGLIEKHGSCLEGIKLSTGYSLLDTLSPNTGSHNQKWGLVINRDIDPKRWMY